MRETRAHPSLSLLQPIHTPQSSRSDVLGHTFKQHAEPRRLIRCPRVTFILLKIFSSYTSTFVSFHRGLLWPPLLYAPLSFESVGLHGAVLRTLGAFHLRLDKKSSEIILPSTHSSELTCGALSNRWCGSNYDALGNIRFSAATNPIGGVEFSAFTHRFASTQMRSQYTSLGPIHTPIVSLLSPFSLRLLRLLRLLLPPPSSSFHLFKVTTGSR